MAEDLKKVNETLTKEIDSLNEQLQKQGSVSDALTKQVETLEAANKTITVQVENLLAEKEALEIANKGLTETIANATVSATTNAAATNVSNTVEVEGKKYSFKGAGTKINGVLMTAQAIINDTKLCEQLIAINHPLFVEVN